MRAIIITALLLTAVPAAAQVVTEGPKAGQVLFGANNSRIGVVDRVLADGSVRVIVGEKLVTVPASTLSVAAGKPVTTLTKTEIRKLG